MNIVLILESILSAIKTSPVIGEYLEPIIVAVFTGSSEIKLPHGIVRIEQNGSPVRFTLKSAGVAIAAFFSSPGAPESIQIGTTKIEYAPSANTATVLA